MGLACYTTVDNWCASARRQEIVVKRRYVLYLKKKSPELEICMLKGLWRKASGSLKAKLEVPGHRYISQSKKMTKSVRLSHFGIFQIFQRNQTVTYNLNKSKSVLIEAKSQTPQNATFLPSSTEDPQDTLEVQSHFPIQCISTDSFFPEWHMHGIIQHAALLGLASFISMML